MGAARGSARAAPGSIRGAVAPRESPLARAKPSWHCSARAAARAATAPRPARPRHVRHGRGHQRRDLRQGEPRCAPRLALLFAALFVFLPFFFFFSLLAQTCGSHFGFLIFFFKSYLFFFPCNLSLLRPRSSRSAIRRGSSAAVRCRAELPAPRSFVSRVRETCSGPAPRRGRPAPGGREGAAGGWGASSARFVLLAVGTDSAGKVGAVGRGIFFIFFFGGVGGMID